MKCMYTSTDQIDIIANSVTNLDLNPHPTNLKQFGPSKVDIINKKNASRIATKEEYKHRKE